MRTYIFSALTVMMLALLAPATASAGTYWKCMGPAVACGSSSSVTGSTYNYRSRERTYADRDDRGYSSRKSRRSAKNTPRKERNTQVAALSTTKTDVQPRAERAEAAPVQKPVRVAASGKTQSGMASYYGTESGSQTASGQRFNPSAMTAAHRTLPFGTRVRVTNKRNGRSVIVTINDRGPFIRGRIIDLSTGAAGVIGMRSSGVAPVTVEVLG